MTKLLNNPLLWRGRGRWPASSRQALLASVVFAVGALGLWLGGVCGCTLFHLSSLVVVLAAALMGGNTLYGAVIGEREKKTLDSLRLTQLTSGQVLLGKLLGEFAALARLLAAAAPALGLVALIGGVGLPAFLWTLVVAGLAGIFASVSAVFVSSLASTTSQAVVGGWIVKGLWLLGTPVLDLVVRAVLVREDFRPLFTAANPVVALSLATIPELAFGEFRWLLTAFVGELVLASLAMFAVAVWRFGQDAAGGAGVAGGGMHPAWRGQWGPAGLLNRIPGLGQNAPFLREVAWQTRTGAGAWPGYLVYLVLFLAPFLYARAWAVQEPAPEQPVPRPQVRVVVPTAQDPRGGGSDPTDAGAAQVAVVTLPGSDRALILQGHRPATCLRLTLYQGFGVPLPAEALRQSSARQVEDPERSGEGEGWGVPAGSLDPGTLAEFGLAPPPPRPVHGAMPAAGRESLGSRGALGVGLVGTLVLFLLYLSIRSAGFLAGALTGERDRRSWQDLALTGIPARQVVWGKLLGALVHPLAQMTLVFPVLLFYALSGLVGPFSLLALYLYSVSLALVTGLVGLYCSAHSQSTHVSQGRAIGLILLAFLVGLLVGPTPILPFLALWMGVRALVRGNSTWTGWMVMAAGLFLAPQALSPLAAVAGFLPTLGLVGGAASEMGLPFVGAMMFLAGAGLALSRGLLERVVDGQEGTALRAEAD